MEVVYCSVDKNLTFMSPIPTTSCFFPARVLMCFDSWSAPSMAIKDIFKVSRRTFVNPSEWVGYTQVKSSFSSSWSLVKELFYPAEPKHKETFAESMARQGLSDDDVNETAQNFLFYSYLFVLCAIFSVIAGFYLLFKSHTFAGFLLSFAVVGLFLVQAFRFNFWYFQIKHRKLGCTLEEWRSGTINSNQEPKV